MVLSGLGLVQLISLSDANVGHVEADNARDHSGTRDEPDLVSYWNFDENSGTNAADSVGSSDGTLDLGVEGNTDPNLAWEQGIIGNGLAMDGQDDILNCGNHPSLDITQEITIIAWVNCRLEYLRPTLIAKHTDADPGYLLRWDRDKGFLFAVESSPIASRMTNLNTVKDKWYQVAATFGDDLHIYINGILADGTATGQIPAQIGTSAADLIMGGRTDDDWNFNGTLDEVKIYSRCLTSTEIKDKFAEVALRGGWTFDDGSGETLSDYSPNSNDGSISDDDADNGDGDTPPLWADSIIDGGLIFDGVDDYVEVSQDPSFDFESNEEFTISAWVKSDNEDGVIISNRDATSYFSLIFEYGYLAARYKSLSGSTLTAITNKKYNNDMWHYMAAVLERGNGGQIRLYVDGDLKASDSKGGFDGIESPKNINIGRDAHSLDNHFRGTLDEIHVWNSAYTEGQIANVYNEVLDQAQVPPSLSTPIDDIITFKEDKVGKDLINVTHHFDDLLDDSMDLNYSIERVSGDHIIATFTNFTLSFQSDEINYTGEAVFKIVAENSKQLTTYSNEFTVQIEPVNDLPIWTSAPPSISFKEDHNHTTSYKLIDYVTDAEDDELIFDLDFNDDMFNISLNEDTNIYLEAIDSDVFGEFKLNVTVIENASQDAGGRKEISFAIDPENDVPRATLTSPSAGQLSMIRNVTLEWDVSDVDDDEGNITFDLYLGKNPDPPIFKTGLDTKTFTATGLDDLSTYYWKVIPNDDEDEGICETGIRNFTVDSLADLPKVRLLTPVNASNIMEEEILLTWETVLDPRAGTLNFRVLVGNGYGNLTGKANTVDNEYLLTDLMPETRYYWTVIPYYPATGGNIEGICISGSWYFEVGDIPKYILNTEQEEVKLSIIQGEERSFNLTLINDGNRDMDISLVQLGDLPATVSFADYVQISSGDQANIVITVNINDNATLASYDFRILLNNGVKNKTVSFTIVVKNKNTGNNNNGQDTKDEEGGLPGWILYVIIGIIAVGLIIIIIIVLVVKRNKKKQEELEAQKAKEEEERRKKEEEEQAKFLAEQDALSKDLDRWKRKDVDYEKFKDVDTEGWEKEYLEQIRKEMKEQGEVPSDQMVGAGEFKLGGEALPQFGSSLKIESFDGEEKKEK